MGVVVIGGTVGEGGGTKKGIHLQWTVPMKGLHIV